MRIHQDCVCFLVLKKYHKQRREEGWFEAISKNNEQQLARERGAATEFCS